MGLEIEKMPFVASQCSLSKAEPLQEQGIWRPAACKALLYNNPAGSP